MTKETSPVNDSGEDNQVHLQAPSLSRNQACLPCRARKIRCDAVKPICGQCQNPRRKRTPGGKGSELELPRCVYGANPTPEERAQDPTLPFIPSKRKRVPLESVEEKDKEIQKLKGRIAALERAASGNAGEWASYIPRPSEKSTDDPFELDGGHASPYPGVTYTRKMQSRPAAASNDDPGNLQVPNPSISGCREPDTGNQLYSLLYPGYPQSLPHVTVVQNLARLFLAQYPPLTSELVSAGQFLFRLTLPPSSEDFPHEALIHAICSLGYLRFGMGPPGQTGDDIFYPRKEDGSVDRSRKYWGRADNPGEYHYTEAKRCCFTSLSMHQEDGLNGKLKVYEVTRSLVLLTYYAYSQNRHLEAWTFSGTSLRFVALGLNHQKDRRAPDAQDCHSIRGPGREGLLPPAVNNEEAYERAMTFWLAFLTDRFAGASTGWAFQIELSDISSFLPIPPTTCCGDYSVIRKALDVHDPNFYAFNPEDLVQSFQLQMKSCIMLSRVVSFMQHAPWHEERDSGIEVRSSDSFQQLDREVVTFRLSFPKPMSLDNLKGDFGIFIAHALLHCATILLHSPYPSLVPDDTSMNRCTSSARAILSTLFLIHDNSMESTFANPFLIFSITTAGRILIRDLAIKRRLNDTNSLPMLETEVQVLLATLSRMGHNLPVCAQTARAFKKLMTDPSPLLRSVNGMSATIGHQQNVSVELSTLNVPNLQPQSQLGSDTTIDSSTTPAWGGFGFEDLQNMGMSFGIPFYDLSTNQTKD